jgi:DNA invertase Pin-like site-specific DNA recombinase
MIIGYARVSTTEQNLGLRHGDLKRAFDASVDPTDARKEVRNPDKASRQAKVKLQRIVHRDLRNGGSERSELALLQSQKRKETRSVRFLLDSRSRLGRIEQRAAGEIADASDRLTGGVIG